MRWTHVNVVLLATALVGLGVFLAWPTASSKPDPVAPARRAVGDATTAARIGNAEQGARADRVSAPADSEAAATARVFGQVLDAANLTPLADAELSLFDFATGATTHLRSGGDGRYEFPDTRGSPGLFQLAIEKPAYGRRVVDEVAAAASPRRDLLAAGLVIRGRVVEAGGAPVPAFRVLAARLPFQEQAAFDAVLALHRQAIPELRRIDRELQVADAGGAFCLGDLAAGNYALMVEAPGRQPLFYNGGGHAYEMFRGVPAQRRDEAAALTIELPAAGVAIVEVVERDGGLPIGDATVSTRVDVGRGGFAFANARAAGAAANRFEVPVALDKNGNIADFDFDVVAPGHAPVRMSIGGYENGHVFLVDLGRPAAVQGVVRDAAGRPLPGAAVLIEREADAGLVGAARTGSDGSYRVDGLDAPSAQLLRCLRPALDSVLATVPLQLGDGETRTVDIGAGAAGSVRGRVTVLGQPQREVLVFLDARTGNRRVHCSTRADGVFAFAGLPADRYELTVSATLAGRSLLADRLVDVRGDAQQIDVDFDRRIAGIVEVVAPRAGEGDLSQLEVVGERRDIAGARDRVAVGADGRFELPVAAAAIYDLTVDGGGDWVTLAPRTVDLRTAASFPNVVLQVARDRHEGRIELQLVDAATGRPADGSVHWSNARTRCSASFEDGRYVEDELSLGHYRFTIRTEAHQPATCELDVTPFQQQVERRIALTPAQSVGVTAVEPGGAAHRAGIRVGDRLRRYGATSIHSIAGLREAIAANNGVVTIVVERDGAEQALTAEAGRLGVELENGR